MIGLLVSPVCVWAVESLKHRFGYDDSFDVFGIHGVGAIVGILTTVFAAPALGGMGYALGREFATQMGVELGIIAFSVAVSAVVSFIAFKIADLTVGLRVDDLNEQGGLDLSSHGESGYRI